MKKIALCISVLIAAAFSVKKTTLIRGTWRAELIRQDGRTIPFIFETKDSAGSTVIYIRNAAERLLVDDITIAGDSVHIQMPFFDSRIEARLMTDGTLQGEWIKRLEKENRSMPFRAVPHVKERFLATGSNTSAVSIQGRWAVDFISITDNDTTHSVGEFEQRGNIVTGTFLTPTGDYRYLEGILENDSLRMSCFDGGHAFLFTAKVNDDKTITKGYYCSGTTHIEKWLARKDANAALPDEYELTKLRPNAPGINFRFKNIDGKVVAAKDSRFKNKVLLLQIMGSWCPNCMDETRFLSAFYNQQKKKEVEIISLAYERSADFKRSQKNIRAFQKRFNVQYPMLVTGVTISDTLRTEKTLPPLEKIKGFPTLIFVDKKGNIRKIHTGFTGPGTGMHYEHFIDDFNKIINELKREK
jgi:thiol-disulfide isomerase/thioredoxin